MRSRLVLPPLLVALSLGYPALALPYSSLAMSSASDMAPLLAPESGLANDPITKTIFNAAKLLNDQGIAHLNQKLQARAEGDFTRAIALAPRAWALYANRAYAYTQRRNYPAALKDIDTALQLSPDNPTLLVRRSNLYVSTRKYDKARTDLDRAVGIAPGNAGVLAQRAMLHLYLDELQAAQIDLDLARAIQPDQSDVRRAESMLASAIKADAKPCEVKPISQASCGLAMITPNASIAQRLQDVAAAELAIKQAEQKAAQDR